VATSYVRVFSPTLVNDFRVVSTVTGLDYVPINFAPGAGLGNQLVCRIRMVTPREQKSAHLFSASLSGVGQSRSLPLYRRENTFQELDNLTWTQGRHTFKVGADFRRQTADHLIKPTKATAGLISPLAFTDSRNPAGKGGDAASKLFTWFSQRLTPTTTLTNFQEYG